MISITLVQQDLAWEDRDSNLYSFSEKINSIGKASDVILLPELFTTGFTMRSMELAESMGGKTMQWMAGQAATHNSILAGSLIIGDAGKFYNRLVWMQPDGSHHHYDKRHLFRMGGENEHYSPGNRPLFVESKGFRFRPLICYDLRFPVWARNRQDYDVLLYLSNWPSPRREVWNTLLKARALENQCFTIGINRIGRDGMGIDYHGETMAFNARGQRIAYIAPGQTATQTIKLSLEELNAFRKKFPVWKDADRFTLDV